MSKNVKLFTLLLVAVIAFSSCVSKKKFEELTSVKDNLATELNNTKSELTSTQEAKEAIEAEYANEKARLNGSIEKYQADLKTSETKLGEVEANLEEKNKEFAEVKLVADGVFANYETNGISLTERGGNIVFNDFAPVYFNSGSVYVKKSNRANLDSLASLLKSMPSVQVMLVGHTDNQPVKADANIISNQRLSYLRAESTAKYLMKQGVSADQLVLSGKGDAQPATPYSDDNMKTAREMNRRVELVTVPRLSDIYAMPRG